MTRRLLDRAIRLCPIRVRGQNLCELVVRIVQRFVDVRIMGLAAEMTYYALLSLFPLTATIGSSLGFLGRFAGAEEAQKAQIAIIGMLQAVFSPEATNEVIAPLVEGLLSQERAGFALGSFLMSLFLASRIFRSAIDTLDAAYGVEERRSRVSLWTLGILFALCAVVVATLILSMVVVGPLLGGGRAIADWLGLGVAFEVSWAVVRWPAVFATATAFLALLYRVGPNVKTTWSQSLPGAIFGMAALVLVAVGFRVYIEAMGLQSPEIENAEDAVALALRAIGIMMATLLWVWLSSMVLLTGGVVNAEMSRIPQSPPPPKWG